MLNSPLENPLSFFRRAHITHRAEGTAFSYSPCGTVRARARAAILRGFLGGLERLALTPPESFSWYRSFATQKNDTPATAVANLINKTI